jgi:hypothetical protein
MSALRMFIPITKVDAAQRLVYGVATAEAEDRAGEICDYESTRPYYEKWSEEIAKSTGGRSRGNLRAMHGAVAAGKVTALTFNDAAKQIEICAKVVDDAEWAKVEEGVYTGFSQGGSYVRRWTDAEGRLRYTANPSEVSLVDLPCLAESSFEMIKRDGSRERRPFAKSFEDSARLAGLVKDLEWLRGSAVLAAAMAPEAGAVLTELQTLIVRAAGLLRGVVDAETARLLPSADAAAKILPTSSLHKRGARNSAADLERIQGLHDLSVDLGASCAASKAAPPGGLEKRFDTLTATLADVLERVKRIEAQPLPLPLSGRTRTIAKSQDIGAADEPPLDALLADPDALSLLAIKLAQRNGRRFMRP